mgnify:FL=1
MKKFFAENNLINIILLLSFFGFGLYLVTGDVLFGNNPLIKQPFWLIIFLFCLTLLFLLCIFAYNIYKHKYKPSLKIGIFLSVIFIIGMITLLVFPSKKIFNFTLPDKQIEMVSYELSNISRSQYIFQYFVLLCMFFVIVDTIPKIFDFDVPFFLSIICVSIVTILMIISYFKDFESYINIFKNLNTDHFYIYKIRSVFVNENSYAAIIFAGLFATLYLHSKNSKFYWYIVDVFFFFNILFTMCKTVIICGFILNVAYLLSRFFITLKEHKKRNIVAMSIIAPLLFVFFISQPILYFNNEFAHTFISNFFDNNGFASMKSRFDLYKYSFSIINQTSVLFGTGYHVSSDVMFSLCGTPFMHNGLLELLTSGGIFLIVCGLLILVFAIWQIIKNFKKHIVGCSRTIVFIAVMLIYMLVESGSMLFPGTLEFAFVSMIIFVPVMKVYFINN